MAVELPMFLPIVMMFIFEFLCFLVHWDNSNSYHQLLLRAMIEGVNKLIKSIFDVTPNNIC